MGLKVLIIDSEGGQGVAWGMDCVAAGHSVKLWINPYADGTRRTAGDGLVPRVNNWREHLRDADLIFPTGNAFALKERDSLISEGYPVFGAGTLGCKLELDRMFAMQTLERLGIDLGIPYTVHNNLAQARKHVEKNGGFFVVKPMNGAVEDKALTHVPSHKDYAEQEIIDVFDKWEKRGGIKGKVMLQEFFPGVEVGISCFFGPGGWSQWKNLCWEHKKLLSSNFGVNTGEMGTVVQYVKESTIFDKFLAPITEYLHAVQYCGDIAVNCIVRKDGTIGFLEYTCRAGWCHWHGVQELHKGDPAQWMLDCVDGSDTLKVYTDPCVMLVMAQPNFPYTVARNQAAEGIPILGLTEANLKHMHFAEARKGKDGRIVTAGEYIGVVSEKAPTIKEASKKAYEIAKYIHVPGKIVRDDVSEKLSERLPELHKHGIATEVTYE